MGKAKTGATTILHANFSLKAISEHMRQPIPQNGSYCRMELNSDSRNAFKKCRSVFVQDEGELLSTRESVHLPWRFQKKGLSIECYRGLPEM